MKAQLVAFSYEAGSWDACRGSSSWVQSDIAIFVPELNLLILKSHWDKVYFYIATEKNGAWQFQPEDYYRDLPKQGFQVLKEIEISDEMARTAADLASKFVSFRDARRNFNEHLQAQVRTLQQEQRAAEEAATQPA